MADNSSDPTPPTPQASEPTAEAAAPSSSWWGWGSSLLSNTVSNVSKASEKLVTDISTFIDPIDEDTASQPTSPALPPKAPATTEEGPHVFTQEEQTDKQADLQTGPTTQIVNSPPPATHKEGEAPKPHDAPVDGTGASEPAEIVEEESEEEEEIGFSEVLDKGVAAIASSAGYFTGFLSRGIETVQNTEITGMAMNFATTAIEKSKQTIATGVRVGETLADRGFDVLEKVGGKARDFIALDTSSPDTPTKKGRDSSNEPSGELSSPSLPTGPQPAPSPPNSANSTNSSAAVPTTRSRAPKVIRPPLNLPSFEEVFEEKFGPKSLQALENISIECMMKTQQMYRRMDATRREVIDDKYSRIQGTFNADKKDDGKVSSVKYDQRTEDQLSIVSQAAQKMKERLATLKAHFTKTLTELKGSMAGDESQELMLMIDLSSRQLESVNQFAELSALCVELLLCAIECLQGKGAAADPEIVARLKSYSLDEKIASLGDLVRLCSEEISALSTVTVEIVRHLGASFKGVSADSETQKAVDKDMSDAINYVFLTAGGSLSNVTESKKFCLTLCKHLTMLVEVEAHPIAAAPALASASPKQPQTPSAAATNSPPASPSKPL